MSNEKLQADLLSIRAELATLVVEHQGCRKELLKATDDVSKLQVIDSLSSLYYIPLSALDRNVWIRKASTCLGPRKILTS